MLIVKIGKVNLNIKKWSLPKAVSFLVIFSMLIIYSCELIGFTSPNKLVDLGMNTKTTENESKLLHLTISKEKDNLSNHQASNELNDDNTNLKQYKIMQIHTILFKGIMQQMAYLNHSLKQQR